MSFRFDEDVRSRAEREGRFLVGVVIRPAKGVGGARYQCETPRFDRDDAAKLTRILTVLFSLDPDGSALARMHEIASEQLRPRDARSCLF